MDAAGDLFIQDSLPSMSSTVGNLTDVVLDPRRMFSRREVWRAWELQGEVCKLCRRSIPFDLMHGDHIVPWSLGGRTVQANLQALCGSCNLRKGTQPQQVAKAYFDVDRLAPGVGEPRKWQRDVWGYPLSRT